MSESSLNTYWAAKLIEGLARSGVEWAILSPGSRCTPLIIACEAYLNTKVLVDERSAAFYALGLAKSTGRPVILVCTSGSAVANWYPAVLEASYSATPLILLSADRPPELLGFGANQTIDQIKFFGNLVRAYHSLPPADYATMVSLTAIATRSVEQSLWPFPGPVHINVPFREPLVPNQHIVLVASEQKNLEKFTYPSLRADPATLAHLKEQLVTSPGFIICGTLPFIPELANAITSLAAALNCPIFADPLSNLRCGTQDTSHVLCGYDAWLARADITQSWKPQWLIQFGTMPVSKRLYKYLEAIKLNLRVIVDAQGNWADPQHAATSMIRTEPTTFCNDLLMQLNKEVKIPDTLNNWQQVLKPLEHLAAELLSAVSMPIEWGIMQDLVAVLPPAATLFIGNSMPIRDLDTCLGPSRKPLRILANRGASGIDGNVSTIAGIAAGSSGTVVGLIGDLALFHDINGLYTLKDVKLILLVMNNDSGGIFRYLPQAKLPTFERNWLTPIGLNISKAAALFGLNYQLITQRQEFTSVLQTALANTGSSVIEIKIDAELSVNQHQAYWAAVAGA